jgi:hypothetical protein
MGPVEESRNFRFWWRETTGISQIHGLAPFSDSGERN